MSENKRKLNEISESDQQSEMDLFDILNLDADESHFALTNFAIALSAPRTMELFKNLNVNQLHYAHDFYDSSKGFPGGLRTSSQYNILAVLFPRKDDRIFGSDSLKGASGATDGTKWNQFLTYRTSRGPTRMGDGSSTKNTFVWMELALYMPRDLVPEEVLAMHDEALVSLADESEGKFAKLSGTSFFLRARVCKPFTMELMNIVQGKTYCTMLDNKELPVVLLRNFIVQKLPNNNGYVLSSQAAGHSKSSLHLVGSMSRNASFVPVGDNILAIDNSV